MKVVFLNEDLFSANQRTTLNEAQFSTPNQMVGRPTKKANLDNNKIHAQSGIDQDKRVPKDEAWLLIKLYEATVDPGNQCDVLEDQVDPVSGEVYGYGGISRAHLLKLCGNANWDVPTEASTFFSGLFKDLDLARVKNGMIYPGPNLVKWLDETEIFTIPNRSRYGAQQGREYAHEPNMRRFLNKGDVGRKTPCSASAEKRPEDPFSGLKGIRMVVPPKKKAEDEDPIPAVPKNTGLPDFAKPAAPGLPTFTSSSSTSTETPVTNTSTNTNSAPTTTWGNWNTKKGFNFKSDDAVPVKSEEPITAAPASEFKPANTMPWATKKKFNFKSDEGEQMAANENYLETLERERTKAVQDAYRKKHRLAEDADITDDNFNEFDFSAVCMAHNWPYNKSKQRLFKKEV